MLKLLMMMLFTIPLCFLISFWGVQLMFIYLSFLLLLMFSWDYNYLFVSYMFGIDLLSFIMLILSFWIVLLMVMSSEKIYLLKKSYKLFILMNLMLMIFLYCTFSVMNLFMFYLFFEMSLIPTLFLILGWGYQPERLQAGVYLLFYTLLASLPMMISIFYLYNVSGSLNFKLIYSESINIFLYICMISAFLVKLPMFMLHLWLPKAHVEAPISGSMILAGVLLKLGGYGLLRISFTFMKIGMKMNYYFICLSLIGGVLISLICLIQVDMKSLIAYSSVSHMGMVLGGLMTYNTWGVYGSLCMMIAHGLCSSGLFCLANISYERLMSRSLFLNKGLINILPTFSMWWFLLSVNNMAAPPSLNLLGEIFLLNSLISWSLLSMIMLLLMSFFSACYSLYLFAFTQHGKLYSVSYSFNMGFIREYLLLFLHWLPLNLLVLKGDFMLYWN
uniref:NADH-ubiquinone oxidoreductase chain 4 n=1 Tax=Clambus sp. CLA01 TaxID=1205546 RepID=A0A0S2MMY4_9COLE|nr:NADH deshydrogenase subunit 4 [Clambus sp. CLA01]